MAIDRQQVRSSAQEHVRAGNWSKAISAFEKLVEDDDSDVRSLLKLADLYTRNDQPDRAVETFSRVGDYHVDHDFHEKAVAVYKQALRIDPERCGLHFKVGRAYRRIGRIRDAVESFRKAYTCFDSNDDREGKIRALQELVNIDHENVRVHVELAETFAEAGRRGRAVETFREAADLLDAEGRPEKFLQVAERILYFDPDDRQLRKRVTDLYADRSDHLEALKHLQVLFNDRPGDIEILRRLARTFHRLGRDEKAALVLHKIAEQYRESGHLEGAEKTLDKIRELDPGNERAKTAVREVRERRRSRRARDTETSPGSASSGTGRSSSGGSTVDRPSDQSPREEGLSSLPDGASPEVSSDPAPDAHSPDDSGSQPRSGDGRERKSTDDEFDELAADMLESLGAADSVDDEPAGERNRDTTEGASGGADSARSAEGENRRDGSEFVDLSDSAIPLDQEVDPSAAPPPEAEGSSAPAESGSIASPSESGDGSDQGAETTDELLEEVDVFLKYGLYDKARELLADLYADQPEHLDVLEKHVDLYDAFDETRAATATLLEIAELVRDDVGRASTYVERAVERADNPGQIRQRADELGLPLDRGETQTPRPDEPPPEEDERPTTGTDAGQRNPSQEAGRGRDGDRPEPETDDSTQSAERREGDEPDQALGDLFSEVEDEDRGPANIGDDDRSGEMAEIDFYLQQGLYDRAAEALDAFRRENPDHPGIDKRQYQIKMARSGGQVEENPAGAFSLSGEFDSVEVGGDGERLSEDTEPVDGRAEATLESSIELGIAYRERGLHDEAIAELEKVTDDPEDGLQARYHIAVCKAEKGETREAAAALSDLLKNHDLSDELRAAARQTFKDIDPPRV